MPAVARLGDPSNHGGTIITATGKYTANGLATAVNGDLHSCPIPGHGITPLTSTSNVTSGGQPVIRVGDLAGCGAAINGGSPNIFANGS
jgi:uncharacterized Zn-binding protein involved in type VI secretion